MSVKDILSTLREAGFKAGIVGGAVRDNLLGRQPRDIDVLTTAPISFLKENFKTVSVGEQYGVLIIDGVEVVSCKDIYDNLSDRDFTLNAMYEDENGLFDPFNGREHFIKGRLICVQDPRTTYASDPIRMLRALRFSADFNLGVELSHINRQAAKIRNCAAERIGAEFCKAVKVGLDLDAFVDSGLAAEILPELVDCIGSPQSPIHHPEGCVFTHTKIVYKNTAGQDLSVRMAALLHDIGKPLTMAVNNGKIQHIGHEFVGEEMASKILQRLKVPGKLITEVCWIVKNHMLHNFPQRRPSKQALLMENPLFEKLLLVHEADCMGRYETGVRKIYEAPRPKATITGKDLKNLGLTPGPLFGRILKDARSKELNGVPREQVLKEISDGTLNGTCGNTSCSGDAQGTSASPD